MRACSSWRNALARLGMQPGDRVGSLAWNTHRHFEMFYGVSGTGAVLHTINPRLFAEQLVYIVNHAEDRLLFVDAATLPVAEAIAPRLTTIEHYVMMCEPARMPAKTSLPKLLCYEELLGRRERALRLARFRRAQRLDAVLHLGHHRQPEGRALFAPLGAAGGDAVRALRHAGCAERRARDDDADGADVPRQCLAVPVPGADDRRAAGAARAQLRARQALRAARRRARHADLRRAHLLADPDRMAAAPRQDASARCAPRCPAARRRRAR